MASAAYRIKKLASSRSGKTVSAPSLFFVLQTCPVYMFPTSSLHGELFQMLSTGAAAASTPNKSAGWQ
jgi:hypothetical protein